MRESTYCNRDKEASEKKLARLELEIINKKKKKQ